MRISGLKIDPYTLRNVMRAGSRCQSPVSTMVRRGASQISRKSENAVDHRIEVALSRIHSDRQFEKR